MEPDTTGSAVVTGRANRLVTTGCLTILIALIIVLGIVVSWLWYRTWHDENVNSEREEKVLASLLQQARDTADATARALDTSGTTDADALTEVIWRHTEAPVITYDTSRREFTATAAKSAQYDEEVIVPGGGPVEMTRCFVFTYIHRLGQEWTSRVSERDDKMCRPGTDVGGMVRLALTRVSNMYAEDLTRAGVQKVLDPTGRRFYDVRNVVRGGDTVTVFVLVSSSEGAVEQCYRFTRPVYGDDRQGSATAVPALSC
ncbi:hypothetical protein [Streptomyces geranii]|uniref:hypothetical protein n=1 Tax=Streptomyces geranii TaxID=2058923 RepID=UPI0013003989|nr:hypothetical protein [Streptomyces geranii]